MTEREAFLKVLEKNEDDEPARMAYADWLDEHGEHEEAERQRKWSAAKAWLMAFCEKNNPPADEDDETWIIDYAALLELGREAFEHENGISCGNNMEMCDALRNEADEFWKQWSIVTGTPLPADLESISSFSCAC